MNIYRKNPIVKNVDFILCRCNNIMVNTDTHYTQRRHTMLTSLVGILQKFFRSIRQFFAVLWKNIEAAQMARAHEALKNSNWGRIE